MIGKLTFQSGAFACRCRIQTQISCAIEDECPCHFFAFFNQTLEKAGTSYFPPHSRRLFESSDPFIQFSFSDSKIETHATYRISIRCCLVHRLRSFLDEIAKLTFSLRLLQLPTAVAACMYIALLIKSKSIQVF